MSSLSFNLSEEVQRLELAFGWELLVDPTARLSREQAESSPHWRSARVGLSWNVQFEDLRDYMGAAWYRTTFDLPAFRDTRHVLLKFGAVDYFCEVFLNDCFVGSHEGGYTPFSFEITDAIRPGSNKLVVKVVDPPMNEAQNRELFPEMMYNEIPHGKQNWYVQISGIWQGVRIECCPSIYVERLDVISKASGEFELIARLAGSAFNATDGVSVGPVELQAEVSDANGRTIFKFSQALDLQVKTMSIKGFVHDYRPWDPADPALYFVEVSLTGAVQYRKRTRFGFRSFAAKDGKLFLNGKPFFMIAALDQDFYPETVHTPGSEESVRDMMTKAKALGINVLRCHLKVAHPVYLDVADEIGMLVWTELPSWSDAWFPADHFSSTAAARAEKMFWEILIRDWNHPCIVLQTIINESWGINLKDQSQREWLSASFHRVKALLKPLGRLVVDNSPCEGNFHIETDLEDFHQYYSMPDQVKQWDTWVEAFADRPEWTFSPYGDAVRTRQEPLVVSEFGNWGLPRLPEPLPWWFQLSFGDHEATRPGGVLDRFHAYGLDTIFENFNELADETQWHQFISLKHEIETIRSRDSLSGYVITGITDVHWEANGLFDMWRNAKVYFNALKTMQQPDLIICNFPGYSFRSEEKISVPVLISHYSDIDLKDARVRWSTSSDVSGSFSLPGNLAPGSVSRITPIELQLPHVDRPYCERLLIEIRSKSGTRIAENSYDIFVLPRVSRTTDLALAADGPSGEMISRWKDAGYRISRDRNDEHAILVADKYSPAVAAHLSEGKNVLLLTYSEDSLPETWPIKVKSRAGSELDGRWFSNFNWIRSSLEPFSSVAFTRILGFESAQVAPRHVIQGIPPDQFGDVLSGITLGWLNRNAALAAQIGVGNGKLIVTTFRFEDYGEDPYATHLLDALLRYISTPMCEPKLQMSPSVPVDQPII